MGSGKHRLASASTRGEGNADEAGLPRERGRPSRGSVDLWATMEDMLLSASCINHLSPVQVIHLPLVSLPLSLLCWSSSGWRRGRTIGRGTSAAVSLATSVSSGEVFVVKSSELSRSRLLQREQRILSSWSELDSPFVVSYFGFAQTPRAGLCYNLFIEYAPRGSVSEKTVWGSARMTSPSYIYVDYYYYFLIYSDFSVI
ncbi:hypothetical protein GW17_00049276 [Ensete ventricosum]|nr:hypothetical protein GW17_00049276 [Ensete ventricosum]